MNQKVLSEKDTSPVKDPQSLQRNIFLLYLPKAVKIEPATYKKLIQK